ncbi:MAG: TonB-dependent receptor plug domain-containing protein, partial [Pseudomonadales bacterium]|nr:TonB-dependent receptor plug domain-containing protein [Pseudomonadales bacterium]
MLIQKKRASRFTPILLVAAVASGTLLLSTAGQAQDEPRRGASAALIEEIVVTARKREETGQEVPLSVSAFGSAQLDALKVRDLTNLSVGMPNVSLEDVGTTRGTANFSIRGLGINSSIPSIDPTVGVFVNGVYMGLNNGIVFDMFDMESVQVLRGPQGTLFGRNVTGGAVLLTNKKPTDSLEATARVAFDQGSEGGLNSYAMGAIGGPVTDNLRARLLVYLNNDQGKFENDFDGSDFGEIEQLMLRGTAVWTPSDTTELVLRYETSTTDGDGPAAQSHTNGSGTDGTPVNNSRDSFDFSIDERGFQDTRTNFVTAELNW